MPAYDNFRGHSDKDAMWVEALHNLAAANQRMAEHARQNPGPYFIFCQVSGAVQSSVDTSKTNPTTTEQRPLQTNRVYSIMLIKKDSQWCVHQVKVTGDVYRDFFVEITASQNARDDLVKRIESFCESNFGRLPENGRHYFARFKGWSKELSRILRQSNRGRPPDENTSTPCCRRISKPGNSHEPRTCQKDSRVAFREPL
jgi:hypothetical protein